HAAVRHDQLDVHVAEARRRVDLRGDGAGGHRAVLRRHRCREQPGSNKEDPQKTNSTQGDTRMMKKSLALIATAIVALPAFADINVGVTLSATGPAASLGIPEKNTIALLPTTIAGQKV